LTINRAMKRDFSNIPDAEPDDHGLIECAVIPLREAIVFPSLVTPITVRGTRGLSALRAALNQKSTVIGIAQRDPSAVNPLPEDLYSVGTELSPGRAMRLPDDYFHVLTEGRRRVEIVEVIQTDPYIIARARPIKDVRRNAGETRVLVQTVESLLRRAADLNTAIPEEVIEHTLMLTEPGTLADHLAAALGLTFDEQQRLLEMREIDRRLQRIAVLLGQEINVLELKNEISSQVQQEMDRGQREMFLREQMRVIQTELGETDIFQQELNEVREQIMAANLPEEIHDRAMKEMSRLGIMPPMAPEVGIIRTYIDWLTSIPWTKTTEDNLALTHAEAVLNQDHYGLKKIKDRIIEYIAVRKLATSKMKSPILCFVGPPGVGKTSLGKSIAKALGREFVRVSLGGVRDEAEIRGHRRTYIGALPGRIIQTMKRAGTLNPVFVLDEIDKLGNDFRGDPSAALLEVLDPEQNYAFSDHYLDVPYDLSKVLFITTANDLDPMPDALIDRLEVIEFSGYIEEEKIAIAQQYLIPNQLEAHGLKDAKVTLEKPAVQSLIREYTYEAGVRNLDREIASVCRKVARQVADNKPYPRRVTARQVRSYLGPAYYTERLAHKTHSIGLVTGLSWTYDGGDILVIEASVLPGKGGLTLTGQLGDVMQESAQTALSYVRSRAKDFDLSTDDFENYDVHLHLPEGAVPKEGPSAGITLATAILSAFTERKVRSDHAMTGEITLRGKVLPVGGIKEKMLAARRAGIHKVILPEENKKDLQDIPKELQADMKFIFVTEMQEVIDRVLMAAPRLRQRDKDREAEEKESKDAEKADTTTAAL
jgi:ATP-dependent Lon protease